MRLIQWERLQVSPGFRSSWIQKMERHPRDLCLFFCSLVFSPVCLLALFSSALHSISHICSPLEGPQKFQKESSLLSTIPHQCQHWRSSARTPVPAPIPVLGQSDALICQAQVRCPPWIYHTQSTWIQSVGRVDSQGKGCSVARRGK